MNAQLKELRAHLKSNETGRKVYIRNGEKDWVLDMFLDKSPRSILFNNSIKYSLYEESPEHIVYIYKMLKGE